MGFPSLTARPCSTGTNKKKAASTGWIYIHVSKSLHTGKTDSWASSSQCKCVVIITTFLKDPAHFFYFLTGSWTPCL